MDGVGFGVEVIDCSVIVPVFRQMDKLFECIEALEAQSFEGVWEVLIVDNSLIQRVNRSEFSDEILLRVIHCPVPGSYAARNAGIKAAKGRVLAFLDADCRPEAQWLRELNRALSQPGTSVIGGPVSLTFERQQARTAAGLFERELAFRQQENIRHGYSVTANLAARREVFSLVGVFNQALFSGGDFEWCRRAGRMGISITFVPDARVAHDARESVSELIVKRRRIEGGAYSRDLAEHGLSYVMRRLFRSRLPLKKTFIQLRQSPELTAIEMARVCAVVLFLQCVSVFERLRLVAGGIPQRC